MYVVASIRAVGAAAVIASFCGLFVPPGCRADEPAAQKRTVEELIEQLGSNRFEERQAAMRQLLDREDAAPALRRALQSPDAEVAKRAAAILDELARRKTRQVEAELAGLAKNGAVDQVVERLVHLREGADEEAAWQAVATLAGRLLDFEKDRFGKTGIQVDDEAAFLDSVEVAGMRKRVRPSVIDFGRYQKTIQPQKVTARHATIKTDGKFLVRAEEVTMLDGAPDSLIVSSGPIRATSGGFSSSIVFSGHSIETGVLANSVIVCDGDVTARRVITGCVVVARGQVKCDQFGLIDCVVVAGGKVDVPKHKLQNSIVKENDPNPLGFVKWFDPASVGIVVEKAEGGLRVKEAAEGKPFAKAGLKAGDLAIAAEGKPVGSPDDFRRLLRKHLATEENLTLEVRRDGQQVKVVVPFGD